MENILATSIEPPAPRRFAGYSLSTLANFAGILLAGLWASWATTALVEVKKREVVTVELAGMMGAFVEAEARSGNPPEIRRKKKSGKPSVIRKVVTAKPLLRIMI